MSAVRAAYHALVPAEFSRLSGLRRLTKDRARLWGIDGAAADDAALIVDELFANAVRYGSQAGDHVALSLSLDGPELRIAVADSKTGTPRPRAPGDDETGGRGLFLVGALAAKWGVDPSGAGKSTWAVLALPSHLADHGREAP